MKRNTCPCVLPSPTEEELAVVPGVHPGTAIRVRVEPGVDGYVRLEQMAYSTDLGWYTQKSFCVPGEMLRALIPHLRKADCLIPRRPTDDDGPLRFPIPAPVSESASEAHRRDA